MKKALIIPLILILASCSNKKGDSDAWGTFEATEITISAEVSGKILQLNLEEGQVIKAGTQIGIIDTIDWVLKKEQLMAQRGAIASKYPNVASQIAVQQTQLKNLQVEKDRIDKLFKDGAATKKQLDDINGSMDMVQKQILSIQTQNTSVGSELGGIIKQIDQIDENLKRCHIINPLDGTVLDKYSEANEMTSTGKALYKIADLSELYLRVYVSGAQLPSIKLGDKVDVIADKDEKENTKLEGVISWISSTAEFTPKVIQTKEERVNLVYAVKVRVKNDGSLKIGMPGEIKLRSN
jgi:HlyD family secretion protein